MPARRATRQQLEAVALRAMRPLAEVRCLQPRLLVADEPVSALDVSIQSQIINLLQKLSRELELTMLFVSHDLSVVRYLADRTAVMQGGKIVEVGETEALMAGPEHGYSQSLLAAAPALRMRR